MPHAKIWWPAQIVTGTVLLSAGMLWLGCPLCRPSATPEQGCEAAARTLARCGTSTEAKWDDVKTRACVATLKALEAGEESDKGFTAAHLRDCGGTQKKCSEALECVQFWLQQARSTGSKQQSAWKPEQHSYVTEKPRQSDVVGTYVLTEQTVVAGGLTALQGKQSELELRADGTFRASNYPSWREGSARKGGFEIFVAAEGRWTLSSVATTYRGAKPKDCWGARFDSDPGIDATAFTGQASRYGLVTVLGDPDSNMALVFKKAEARR